MKMTGEYRIGAPRQKVWEALNDPEVLKVCIPGCEEIEKVSDTEFTAKVRAKVGPVNARFAGKVTLSDLNPPNGYTISGQGQGGAAGFAKGGAKVRLSDGAGDTLLAYDVDAQVGGKLAQIGSRLVDQTAKKMADEFFGKFAEVVGAPPPEKAAPAAKPEPEEQVVPPTAEDEMREAAMRGAAPGHAAPMTPSGEDERKRGLPTGVWAAGIIVIVLILLAIFGFG